MKERTGHIDIVLFIAVLALMLFSIGVVYSASIDISRAKNEGDFTVLFMNHAVRVLLAVCALFAGAFIDYHIYKSVSKYILLMALVFLFLTPFFGISQMGAKRWLGIGAFQFQPSEFAKYALVIHLSVLLSAKQTYIKTFRNGFLPLLFWIGAVAGLIAFQNNLSTVVLILLIGFLLMYVGRVRILHLLGSVASALPLVALYALSKPYRLKRIMDYFGSEIDPASGVDQMRSQVEQAVIGLGNGGLFGVGIGMSKQRELFLPESYSDFIFAIVGEEYGFVGATIVLTLFIIILFRGMKIAKRSTDDLGRFLAAGISITIILGVIINAMVTTGLLPTTGLPMPLISYGGTSIVFTAFALGIVLNVSMYTRIRPRMIHETPTAHAKPVGEVYP
ncbi:MAG: putative peptidoglycan glycosyltransferase FtsW [Bacteroidota bacterium]|nr:putative peptidoglycan glycosyltransferase FtsW [Bacteroidota bacterium]